MDWQTLNWRRGAFRVWVVASLAWLAFGVYHLFFSYPGVGDYPDSYERYLPECAGLTQPESSGLARGLPNSLENSTTGPLLTCAPPITMLRIDGSRTPNDDQAYQRCIATREREAAEQERRREEEAQACVASRQRPDNIANAKAHLGMAQIEWTGSLLLALLVLFALPIGVWFVGFWIVRLAQWIAGGFSREP